MFPVPNINSITSVYCDTDREVQFSPFLTMSTKHPQELPLGCEDLDAMVITICNIHISSAVTSYIVWLIKLSLSSQMI